MKWLFLLLLAANIALFVWGWDKQQQTTRQIVVLEPELGDLTLLSEAPAEAMAASEVAPVDEVDAQPGSPLPPSVDASAKGPEPVELPSPLREETEQAAESTSKAAAANSIGDQMRASDPVVVPPPVLESEPTLEQTDSARPENAKAVAEAPSKALPVDLECGVIGPIENENELRSIVTGLVEQQVTASQRTESILKTVGFWVIIEPYGSQKQAIDAVNALKQQGITDLRRFYKGQLKNGISLGMYRRERNAETRRKQIAAKGFPAELLARRKKVSLYFIDYQGPAPVVKSMRKKLAKQYPAISVRPESCPRIATPGGIF